MSSRIAKRVRLSKSWQLKPNSFIKRVICGNSNLTRLIKHVICVNPNPNYLLNGLPVYDPFNPINLINQY